MFWLSLLGGVFVGVCNGFFGGGGGLIAVPVLAILLKMEEKFAHATAILVILPLSVFSAVVYLISNPLNWLEVLWVGIGVIYGGIIGALLLKKLSNKALTIIFAVIMLIAGVRMVI